MKGKITIVLLGIALVFGMIAASCDNDAYPAADANVERTLNIYESDANDLPVLYNGNTVVAIGAAGWEDALPKLLKNAEAYDKLYGRTQRTQLGDGSWVQTYIMGEVKDKPGYDANQKALAAKRAGMPIAIKNPILP